jgi:hypothetical protein
MQMVFDQHSSPFQEPACTIRLEIGAKLRTEFVRTFRHTQALAYALRGGTRDLGIRHVVANGIHQTVEVFVGHCGILKFF